MRQLEYRLFFRTRSDEGRVTEGETVDRRERGMTRDNSESIRITTIKYQLQNPTR